MGAVERLLPGAKRTARAIGPFHVLERVGAGGMGVIYLAERRAADFTSAAVKLLDDGACAGQLAAPAPSLAAWSIEHHRVHRRRNTRGAALAMEYVDGELLEYGTRRDLDVRARVRCSTRYAPRLHTHALGASRPQAQQRARQRRRLMAIGFGIA